MVFTAIYWFSTALIATVPAVLAASRRPRFLLFTVVLFPLANVYVAGLAMFAALAIVVLQSNASRIPILSGQWFLLWWSAWAVWAIFGFLANGVTERQLFQAVEFLFYGILAIQVVAVCRSDGRLFLGLVAAEIVSAVVLSLVCILATISSNDWPARLVGRNEAAYYIVMCGILPSLFLLSRPTWLARIFRPKVATVFAVLLCGVALLQLQARGAMLCGLLLVAGYVLYLMTGRRLLSTALVVVIAVPLATIALVQSDSIALVFDTSTNFSNLERLSLLQASFRLFEIRPLLGWGWGSVDSLMPAINETVLAYPHPHNFLAHFAVELGIGGIVLLGLLVARPLYRAYDFSKRGFRSESVWCVAVAFCLVILGMIDVLFYGASRAIPTVVLLAFVEALPFDSFVFVEFDEQGA